MSRIVDSQVAFEAVPTDAKSSLKASLASSYTAQTPHQSAVLIEHACCLMSYLPDCKVIIEFGLRQDGMTCFKALFNALLSGIGLRMWASVSFITVEPFSTSSQISMNAGLPAS